MTAAIVAHEQNPATGFLYSLLIDGQDVISQVDYSTIHVTEAGPGAVSSMGFTIRDPTKLVTVQDYASIQMWDYARDLPVFTGWPERQQPTPGYGGAGRDIEMTCYGVEALLDQIIVPTFTPDADAVFFTPDMLQVIAANAPLRAFYNHSLSTQAWPISDSGAAGRTIFSDPVPSIAGLSIRSAFETWYAAVKPLAPFPTPQLTVDFWLGLRLWAGNVNPAVPPFDYAAITVVETAAGSPAAASLRWTFDTAPGSIITSVYVKGGNAAGTGWVAGDTTKGRGQAYVNDSDITTEIGKQSAASAILGQKGTGAGRGTITFENFTPVNAHPGSALTITNNALGWSAESFVISQIDKTFLQSGKQDWTISFFDVAAAPAAAGRKRMSRRVRALTRTLS